MLDAEFIRENPRIVKKACADKNVLVDVDKFLDLDGRKRKLMVQIENLRARRNALTKEQIEEGRKIKKELKSLELEFGPIRDEWVIMRKKFPNIPFSDVPVGKDDSENVVLRKVGKLPKFNFTPKEHWQLGQDLDIIDLERASKIAGS